MLSFLTSKFSSIFSGLLRKGTLSENDINQALALVKQALIEADVPYQLINDFCSEIQAQVAGQKIITALKPTEQLIKVVHEKLQHFLTSGNQNIWSVSIPSMILIMGLQGSGKTTTCAKIAHWLKKDAEQKKKTRRILLASVDFYRPAAIDQLEVVARQAGVDFYRAQSSNAYAAAIEIAQYAQKNLYEITILDTAGRLHIDEKMIQELKDIESKLKPKHKVLVLDAMTGQESLKVAQAFNDAIGFEGAIMTKMDSDTRGGAAFSFAYALKKPVLFMGTGEKIDDFERFHADRIATRILGMGDVLSLIEKANAQIKQSEQESLYKTMMKGQMTLVDFAKQLEMMNKMGSFGQIMKYMPGLGQPSLTPEMIERAELELKRFRAIINSMTPKERIMPHIIDGSRKKRIALGAGVQQADVAALLARFQTSQQYVKLLKKSGRFPGLF